MNLDDLDLIDDLQVTKPSNGYRALRLRMKIEGGDGVVTAYQFRMKDEWFREFIQRSAEKIGLLDPGAASED